MEGAYDVLLGSEKMGTVLVKRQGLYWQFDCRCRLSGDVMYDLVVSVGKARMKLGLLIPNNGYFILSVKVPAKRLGQGIPQFFLQSRHTQMKGHFVPVDPDEPFRYLHRLESAYLAVCNSQIGLVMEAEK